LETNPPLIVDADAVLALAVAYQRSLLRSRTPYLRFFANHNDAVEIREGSIRGKIIARFNDHTGDMEILRFFTKVVGKR
jgi:hypothetical protein